MECNAKSQLTLNHILRDHLKENVYLHLSIGRHLFVPINHSSAKASFKQALWIPRVSSFVKGDLKITKNHTDQSEYVHNLKEIGLHFFYLNDLTYPWGGASHSDETSRICRSWASHKSSGMRALDIAAWPSCPQAFIVTLASHELTLCGYS